MKLPMYQIDAFAERPFEGNPAAVCPLDGWIGDDVMQSIAAENNLSETVFFVPENQGFAIRWFTPTTEVDLCGHATLAAAWVLFYALAYHGDVITFYSRSGTLRVSRENEMLLLDFPRQQAEACPLPIALAEAFDLPVIECLKAEDYIIVVADAGQVAQAQPELARLMQLDGRGVIITAPATAHDFVLRFFAPKCGIDEDPVTGSAFTQLAPYWAERLGRDVLSSRQLSKRGGDVRCRLAGDRVEIGGRAVCYLNGEIEV